MGNETMFPGDKPYEKPAKVCARQGHNWGPSIVCGDVGVHTCKRCQLTSTDDHDDVMRGKKRGRS